MSATTQTYLLTLYVTYQQETAIRDLFSSNGWLYRKKDDDKDCESFEEQAETIESQDCLETSYTGEDDSDDDATVGSENKEKAEDNIGNTDAGKTTEAAVKTVAEVDKEADHPDMDWTEIKTEAFADDDGDDDDDMTADLDDDNDDDDDSDEYLPDSETKKSGRKRKMTGPKTRNKKLKTEKKGRKAVTKKTKLKTYGDKTATPKTKIQKGSRSSSKIRKAAELNDNSEKNEISSCDTELNVDPERLALELELQETDDIDHYETVHTSLSPDEPFSPPSDVQESDGYSPSLGCYYCHDCGYTFQLQHWYDTHKWKGRCVYPCQVCSEQFTFRNISAYRTHIKTHNSVPKEEINEKLLAIKEEIDVTKVMKSNPYKCTYCSRSFKDLAAYQKCMSRHDPTDTAQCRMCHKSFHSQEELDAHNNDKHRKQCQFCGKTVLSKANLREHMYRVHQQKDNKLTVFECPFGACQQKFLRQLKFEDHLTTHTGTVRYTCRKCQKQFGQRGSWMEHEKMCLFGNKLEHVCQMCSLAFKHRGSLKYHRESIHENRKFQCQCGRTFRYQPNLKRHSKKCSVCQSAVS